MIFRRGGSFPHALWSSKVTRSSRSNWPRPPPSQADKAIHLNPGVSVDNILLLLTTAVQRVRRGEELSAHAFLTMTGEMVISLEKRQRGAGPDADLLDPRRRLERTHSELAINSPSFGKSFAAAISQDSFAPGTYFKEGLSPLLRYFYPEGLFSGGFQYLWKFVTIAANLGSAWMSPNRRRCSGSISPLFENTASASPILIAKRANESNL